MLTSTMLMIVIASSFYANHVLNFTVENALFDQAANVMVSVDKITKGLMFDPGSSGEVRTSFQSILPYFAEMGNLTVSVNRTSAATGGYMTATGGYMRTGDGASDWGSARGTISFLGKVGERRRQAMGST
jgi:hypothetical protein